MRDVKNITALNAVTATTTSGKFLVSGFTKLGFRFTRANHASGNTVFTVNLSPESPDTVTPTMVATNMLIKDIAADAGAGTAGEDIGYTRVASVTLASNATETVWLDPAVAANWVSVTATETTDGTHSAEIIVVY